MHTVQRLELALAQARKQGFQIRQEWLETGGGVCEFNGKRWLFIDLSQSATEQLAQVRESLRQESARNRGESSAPLPPPSADQKTPSTGQRRVA